jgi:beta-glucosidase
MAPSDFAKADLSKILEELTVDEAISLIAGVGFWHTCAIERLGIPSIKVSDGPNGIRGNHFLMSTPAKVLLVSRALPCRLILLPFVAFSINEVSPIRTLDVDNFPLCNPETEP